MKRFLTRIKGIQTSPNHPYSTFIQNIKTKLVLEYDNLFKFEEDFQRTKFRINQLLQGSSNTRFFYALTLNRKRRKKILNLKDKSRNWIGNQCDISKHITDFYSELYTTGHLTSQSCIPNSSLSNPYSPSLNATKVALLSTPLRDSKIIKTIKYFKPLKAPGPDDIQPIFFQRYWETVHHKVVVFCMDTFKSCTMNPTMNETLFV